MVAGTTSISASFIIGALLLAGARHERIGILVCTASAVKNSGSHLGFLTTSDWHDILWEIGLDRMRVVVDGDVRFDGAGDYSGIESAPSVGPCFGSTISVREFSITPLA